MIQISGRFSNRVIKKGDYFTIYIGITNGHEKDIKLNEVKISQPIGFIPVTSKSQDIARQSIGARILEWLDNRYGKKPVGTSSTGKKDSGYTIEPTNDKVKGSSIIHEIPEVPLEPKSTYSEIFYLKAGWSGGFRPRPDTYTLSCDVTYEVDGKISFNSIKFDVSIFPSLGSMLAGTIVGSLLGTFVKELLSRSDIMSNFQTIGILGTVAPIFPSLFTNMILGFIVGVVLMRKKDVQPFLTIEDFWGGILVGFLTSYTSAQLLEQLSHMQIVTTSQ